MTGKETRNEFPQCEEIAGKWKFTYQIYAKLSNSFEISLIMALDSTNFLREEDQICQKKKGCHQLILLPLW